MKKIISLEITGVADTKLTTEHELVRQQHEKKIKVYFTHKQNTVPKWRRQRAFGILQFLDPLLSFVKGRWQEDDDVKSPLSPE